ncbi:nitrogenase iron protein NifH [Sinanaerobacter sp. ZZT-01]|uniref:nitrogenase iron protein NifH n=1 Tax=Sinanaerobacter sp. ZZT-01 TaxID=3111540 RepID=UPI002D79E167|nr:nitrogenase iron protein NifH [Sinanaerobacter sp. ZZT-01]WRR94708.1 nitrogenase iron protein NifH [Sinanaerobacter sp. ZZT-01]
MNKRCIRIALYGKGGIGKSTVASNVSAAFGDMGLRVLHIGCDPKADSTRNLIGFKIPTVLDVLSEKSQVQRKDILFTGFKGISCIEAGGPKPGTGCAGMGISIMADELERLGILEENWDVIIYDVLGDVVCGGFSIPMRKHFVDQVYIVSSSELMSLYAANNIMKGLQNCSSNKQLLCGMIHNRCSGDESNRQMNDFARKTNTTIIHAIKQSNEIRKAECQRKTVIEAYFESESRNEFLQLAQKLLKNKSSTIPKTLEDEEIDRIGLNLMYVKMQRLIEEDRL